MFDIKWLRDNPDEFDAGMLRRGLEPQAGRIIALDARRRENIVQLQDAQARRNAASKAIGQAKAKGDEAEAVRLIAEVATLKQGIQDSEEKNRAIDAEIEQLLAALPNIPLADVPDGGGEDANELVRTVGSPQEFPFPPRQHFDLGENLGLMDFDKAAKISGARFVVLKGPLAQMERALAAFMLDIHTNEFGYEEVLPPVLVRDQAVFGTAQLPKFAEDLFRTENGYWLTPTAEVPLTNLVRESILDAEQLPLRFTAHTQCFRSEAGSAGRDTRGIIRQHQFSKVEMVSIVEPEKAMDELERMTTCAEEILKRLGLAYRVMMLCTGDMGFSARKTYDIEVWLPGQGAYREISSCSVCGDFQARRMSARFRKPDDGREIGYVHTLNGSGLAVGRTMVAVLENYQRDDGSIVIPKALQPYMNGMEEIS
jgi:seryl-tRNA synthetase